jgi:hypothetical protein
MSIAADAVWLQTKRILLGRKKLTKLCTRWSLGMWSEKHSNAVQGSMILHIIIHPTGTYGRCVLAPCISNMVQIHQQFAVAKKDIPDPVGGRVKFSKTVPRNCYFIKQTSQKMILDNFYKISMLTLPLFFSHVCNYHFEISNVFRCD